MKSVTHNTCKLVVPVYPCPQLGGESSQQGSRQGVSVVTLESVSSPPEEVRAGQGDISLFLRVCGFVRQVLVSPQYVGRKSLYLVDSRSKGKRH